MLEALASMCRNDPGLPAALRSIAPTWLLQLPWLANEAERETLRRELAGAGQERMLRELGELLDHTTQDRALLLVTEDLHWSDQATLHLIDHVARRRGPARLLWLASFRLAEVIADDHPLKALRHELRLHRLAEEIALDPFSEREVADYVAGRFPDVGEAPEAFVRALHSRTDGLPLFVVNLIDELSAQGLLDSADAWAQVEHGAVPENLAGVIEKQVARLAHDDRALLEAASVCGVEFRAASVADAIERDLRWVGERCDEFARRQQWLAAAAVERLPDGSIDARYAFRHALYRHVLYQRIGAPARMRLHQRVARSLERSRGEGAAVTAAELAVHCERSHKVPAALHHYAEAAENALRHFAPIEAMTLTASALALLPLCAAGSDRDALELELLGPRAVAASQLLGTTAPESTAAFERIEALSESLPGKSRRALEMELGWVYQARGEYDKAKALAMRKAALAERRGDRVLAMSACNLMGATLFFQGDLAAARLRCEQGLAAFDEVADQVASVSFVMDPACRCTRGSRACLSHLGLMDQARSHSDRALQRAASLGQPYGLVYALLQAGLLALRVGELEGALQCADSLRRIVADHAVVEGDGFARWLRGAALVRLGQPDAGLPLVIEGHAIHLRQGRVSAGCASILGYAAEALMQAARWREAQVQLDEALALAQRIGERIYLPDLLGLQARLALGSGDATAARASLHEALREANGQRALWLELSTRVALCELPDAAAEDLAALRQARAGLREGLDAPLVKAADALLRAA